MSIGLGLIMSNRCNLIFHFQPRFIHNQSYNLIKTDTLVFCTIFRISPIIFG